MRRLLDQRLMLVPMASMTKAAAIKELIDRAAELKRVRDTLDLLQAVLNRDGRRACRIAGEPGDSGPAALFVCARSANCIAPFVGVGIAREDLPASGSPDVFRILTLLVVPQDDVSLYVWAQGRLLRQLRSDGLRRALSGAASADKAISLLCTWPDGEAPDARGRPAGAGAARGAVPVGSPVTKREGL